MKIVEKKLSELKPYKNNPKRHSKKQIDYLANSLTEFGWKQPLVIEPDGTIIAGHGRYLAAKELSKADKQWNKVPCVLADDLTEDQMRAYRLVDNRIFENDYDLELEFAEMQEIELDLGDFGIEMFDMNEIEEVDAYDAENDNSEFFSATFTFPTAKKKQITKYLREHKAEITEEIIQKAGA